MGTNLPSTDMSMCRKDAALLASKENVSEHKLPRSRGHKRASNNVATMAAECSSKLDVIENKATVLKSSATKKFLSPKTARTILTENSSRPVTCTSGTAVKCATTVPYMHFRNEGDAKYSAVKVQSSYHSGHPTISSQCHMMNQCNERRANRVGETLPRYPAYNQRLPTQVRHCGSAALMYPIFQPRPHQHLPLPSPTPPSSTIPQRSYTIGHNLSKPCGWHRDIHSGSVTIPEAQVGTNKLSAGLKKGMEHAKRPGPAAIVPHHLFSSQQNYHRLLPPPQIHRPHFNDVQSKSSAIEQAPMPRYIVPQPRDALLPPYLPIPPHLFHLRDPPFLPYRLPQMKPRGDAPPVSSTAHTSRPHSSPTYRSVVTCPPTCYQLSCRPNYAPRPQTPFLYCPTSVFHQTVKHSGHVGEISSNKPSDKCMAHTVSAHGHMQSKLKCAGSDTDMLNGVSGGVRRQILTNTHVRNPNLPRRIGDSDTRSYEKLGSEQDLKVRDKNSFSINRAEPPTSSCGGRTTKEVLDTSHPQSNRSGGNHGLAATSVPVTAGTSRSCNSVESDDNNDKRLGNVLAALMRVNPELDNVVRILSEENEKKARSRKKREKPKRPLVNSNADEKNRPAKKRKVTNKEDRDIIKFAELYFSKVSGGSDDIGQEQNLLSIGENTGLSSTCFITDIEVMPLTAAPNPMINKEKVDYMTKVGLQRIGTNEREGPSPPLENTTGKPGSEAAALEMEGTGCGTISNSTETVNSATKANVQRRRYRKHYSKDTQCSDDGYLKMLAVNLSLDSGGNAFTKRNTETERKVCQHFQTYDMPSEVQLQERWWKEQEKSNNKEMRKIGEENGFTDEALDMLNLIADEKSSVGGYLLSLEDRGVVDTGALDWGTIIQDANSYMDVLHTL